MVPAGAPASWGKVAFRSVGFTEDSRERRGGWGWGCANDHLAGTSFEAGDWWTRGFWRPEDELKEGFHVTDRLYVGEA